MNREKMLMIALTVIALASTANCVINSYAIRDLKNEFMNISVICEHLEEN